MRKFEVSDTDYNVIMNALERYRNEMREEVDAANKVFEPTLAYQEWVNTCVAIVNIESQA